MADGAELAKAYGFEVSHKGIVNRSLVKVYAGILEGMARIFLPKRGGGSFGTPMNRTFSRFGTGDANRSGLGRVDLSQAEKK